MARCCATVLLLVAVARSDAAPPDGRELFNGKDLTGWVVEGARSYKDGGQVKQMWTVGEGVIHCAGRGFGFLRYEKQEFGDFALHVEYRLTPKGNSGIGIRTRPFDGKDFETRPSVAAFEVQLLDDADQKPNAHGTGSLYGYVAPTLNAARAAPKWNAIDVECVGPRIRVTVNGQKVLDVDQTAHDKIKNKALKGFICLQSHSRAVDFRNVRVREVTKP